MQLFLLHCFLYKFITKENCRIKWTFRLVCDLTRKLAVMPRCPQITRVSLLAAEPSKTVHGGLDTLPLRIMNTSDAVMISFKSNLFLWREGHEERISLSSSLEVSVSDVGAQVFCSVSREHPELFPLPVKRPYGAYILNKWIILNYSHHS